MERDAIEALLDDLSRYLKAKDGKELPDSQRAVLYACLSWGNLPYQKMPDKLSHEGYGRYSWKTLKNDGYIVFGRLTNVLGDDIKKKNCYRKLLDWHRSQRQSPTPAGTANPMISPPILPVPGNLLEFESWQSDIVRLTQAVARGQRIVCISGPARIGKTFFTHTFVERISTDFDVVMWCQASEVGPIDHLYRDVCGQVTLKLGTPDPMQARLNASPTSALLELLQTHRILLIVDQTEVLYCPQQLAGQFRPEYTDYKNWLKRLLGLPALRGCLVWVGREPPACFDVQYSTLVWHRVGGLTIKDAARLLECRNFDLNAMEGWEDLVAFCGGNPAWMLMEGELLQRSRTTDISQFLLNPSLHRNAIEILEQVLANLSFAEQTVLGWLLAIPLAFHQFRDLDSPDVLPPVLEEALASLVRRSLVTLDHTNTQCYRSVLPLLEYVLADQVVQWVIAELSENRLAHALGHPAKNPLMVLRQYPLWHGATAAERQDWQQRNILAKIATEFRQRYGFRQEQINQLAAVLGQIRKLPPSDQGYAVGNVLNIAISLGLALDALDISGLAIRHVDLRQAILGTANFDHCWFQSSLLPLNLEGPLVADMTADGGAIAIGDVTGALWYWQRTGTSLQLCVFHQLDAAIDNITFQDSHTLIVVSGQTVYQWWIDDEQSPPDKLIEDLSAPASSIAKGHLGHIAIGLTSGQIILWNDISYQRKTLSAHKSEVCHLTFSADGQFLVSMGMDNQGLIWDLAVDTTVNNCLLPYTPLPSSLNMCVGVGWMNQSLLRAEVGISLIRLRIGADDLQEQAIAGQDLIALNFSPNGRYLSGSSTGNGNGNGGLLFCWDWQASTILMMKQRYSSSEVIATCNQGRWLLVMQPNAIQLIDLHRQTLLWQAETGRSDCTAISLAHVQGLNPAEEKVIHRTQN